MWVLDVGEGEREWRVWCVCVGVGGMGGVDEGAVRIDCVGCGCV